MLAGFSGFPRTGALASATWGHFSSSRDGEQVTLALPTTKGGHRRSASEAIQVVDSLVCKMLFNMSKNK